MQQDFITLTTYTYPHDAELTALKALLDDHQVRYYVMDDHFLGVVPFDTQAIGGVKVRVISSQWGRANQLLQRLKQERPRELQPFDDEDAAWMAMRQAEEADRERQAKRLLRILALTVALGSGGTLLAWLLG